MSALVREILDAIEGEREMHARTASELPIDRRGHELGLVAGLDRAAAIVGRLAAAQEARYERLVAIGGPDMRGAA